MFASRTKATALMALAASAVIFTVSEVVRRMLTIVHVLRESASYNDPLLRRWGMASFLLIGPVEPAINRVRVAHVGRGVLGFVEPCVWFGVRLGALLLLATAGDRSS